MRTLPRLLAAALVCCSAAARAQNVVTDPGLTAATIEGNAQNVAKQLEQIAEMRKSVAHAQAMLDQARSQYQAISGSRNLGTILMNPALRDYIPADWQGVYDSVRMGGYQGLTGAALKVREIAIQYDTCKAVSKDPDKKKADEARRACEARAVKAALDKQMVIEAFDKARQRLAVIEQLMAAINRTTDAKSIAELQARIAAEQAAIQNEQTKLMLFKMAADAEAALQEQQARAIELQRWSSPKGIGNVAPVTFQ